MRLQHCLRASFVLLAGASFKPSRDKRQKWIQTITAALERGRLTDGEASKLSGALQWSTQHSFRRLGRAMLRPLIRWASGNIYILVCACFVFTMLGKLTATAEIVQLAMSSPWR